MPSSIADTQASNNVVCLISLSHLSGSGEPLRRLTGVIAARLPWSQDWRTPRNETAHAAEACWPTFTTVRLDPRHRGETRLEFAGLHSGNCVAVIAAYRAAYTGLLPDPRNTIATGAELRAVPRPSFRLAR